MIQLKSTTKRLIKAKKQNPKSGTFYGGFKISFDLKTKIYT